MKIIQSINEMHGLSVGFKKKNQLIGLVPTMGALHNGHLSLIRKARGICDIVVVSIFVNPKQFSSNEDLSKYPRTFLKDKSLCKKSGVDYIFFPNNNDIYPDSYLTYIEVEKISNHLCGKTRPGHFRGVATIILKLFNIVMPDKAFFGEKDFQQLKIIEKLTEDLNLPIEIISCPIVREIGGLALSSRNTYLTQIERLRASSIYKALVNAKNQIRDGSTFSTKVIKDQIKRKLIKIPNSRIDYIKLYDNHYLNEYRSCIKLPARILVAVWVGKSRLIDNILVK